MSKEKSKSFKTKVAVLHSLLGTHRLLVPRTLAVSIGVFSVAFAGPAQWTDHARRFTGESQNIRSQAISELRKDPQLREKLKRALGTKDHFLALDVISALRMREMLPTLMQAAGKDPSGYVYHAINSLLTPADHAMIVRVYLQRLEKGSESAASRVALIDSLARLRVKLDFDFIERLASDHDPDIRSAAVSLARSQVRKLGRKQCVRILMNAVQDAVFQVRLQAIYALSELRVPDRAAAYEACRRDLHPEVRLHCEILRTDS